MYEIRFHGRGGQGAVLASKILAKAFVEEGKFVKAIPSFGFERRGAPVEAFLRVNHTEIRQNTNIYHPDCIVCLDPTLPRTVNIFSNVKSPCTWIQATKKSPNQVNLPEAVAKAGFCDAFGISLNIFGRPITNSIMLGALIKTTDLCSVESICKGMESVAFRDADLDKNMLAVHRGYDETQVRILLKKEMK
jgi:pyruvate ferredoxin oxidoreductase gamma subunit/phenylglyoxylate dehydrogenase gamma subunit